MRLLLFDSSWEAAAADGSQISELVHCYEKHHNCTAALCVWSFLQAKFGYEPFFVRVFVCVCMHARAHARVCVSVSLVALAKPSNGLYAFRFSLYVLCMCASAEVLMGCVDLFLEGLNGFKLSGHSLCCSHTLVASLLQYTHTHTHMQSCTQCSTRHEF